MSVSSTPKTRAAETASGGASAPIEGQATRPRSLAGPFSWLPNALTGLRALCGLVLPLTLLTPLAWLPALVFLFGALTDFLDGFLARRAGWISPLGRVFDPIADKLLLAGALFVAAMAGTLGGVHGLAVLLILGREFLVSGLREYLGTQHRALPVSGLGKAKTAVQFIACTGLLLVPAFDALSLPALIALWLAAAVSVASGLDYLRKAGASAYPPVQE